MKRTKDLLIEIMESDEELELYEEEFCYYSGLPSPAAYEEEKSKTNKI